MCLRRTHTDQCDADRGRPRKDEKGRRGIPCGAYMVAGEEAAATNACVCRAQNEGPKLQAELESYASDKSSYIEQWWDGELKQEQAGAGIVIDHRCPARRIQRAT